MHHVIATGAFGTVHHAEWQLQTVAVKQAKVQDVDGVVDEFLAVRHIIHPHVVAHLGIACDFDRHLGMLMELCVASLHELMHAAAFAGAVRQQLTWEQSMLALVTDVAKGMACLHSYHLLHRDLKPLNVLLNCAWVAKVADFGEAKQISFDGEPFGTSFTRPSRAVSSAGSAAAVAAPPLPPAAAPAAAVEAASRAPRIHGSAPYVSPEATLVDRPDAPRVGKPTDVWSYGCLLAHCAARKPPYTDVCRGPEQVRDCVDALRAGTAQPLSRCVPGENIPSELVSLARECTQYAPSARPTFEQIVARLAAPSLIAAVCHVSVSDDDDDLEAARPRIRLVRPQKPSPPVMVPTPSAGSERMATGTARRDDIELSVTSHDQEGDKCIIS